jgi:hypothetical protein
MKKYTHAWLAFMAIKRLERAEIPANYRKHSLSLIDWFMDNRDFVMQGAWYPDAIIKDMATSHVHKYSSGTSKVMPKRRKLPGEYNIYNIGKETLKDITEYHVVKGNLPDRCDALVHSIVDNLKMQESEQKGSPISPTDNHVATLFFMLSHYIADAHMPLHCDERRFSDGDNIHAHIEKLWDEEIKDCYEIDSDNERFRYDKYGYPLKIADNDLCNWLEQEIVGRKFTTGWGSGNGNTWDFMSAITQYSFLTSYKMIPKEYDETNLTWDDFKNLNTGYNLIDYNKYILIDAIDSIAKIWLRTWTKYRRWLAKSAKV